MKIHFFDKENMMIYLNKHYTKTIDLDSQDELEDYFKQLFLRLHQYYDISLHGYYNIILYCDRYYGMVIHLSKEEIDYYNYFDKEIDMRIVIDKTNQFLYQIDDYFALPTELQKKITIYYYRDHFYVKVKRELTDIEFAILLEQAILHYQQNDSIIKNGMVIKE